MRSHSFVARALFLPLVVALAIAAPAAAATTASVPAEAQAAISGTGTLAAKGAGSVRLAGSYVATGSMDGGWLKVTGVTPWTVIRVTGWASKTRFADGSLLFRGSTARSTSPGARS